MPVATTNETTGKSRQATFLKVGQNLYRNESSDTYYGLTKRGGKQFRTALRMEDGTPIEDRGLAERALRKWLNELENILPEAIERDEIFAIVKKDDVNTVFVGGLASCYEELSLSAAKTVSGLSHRPARPPIRVAVAVAVPAIEAWLLFHRH